MLRMIQSQSAEQAKDYHNDALLKSDYYLNDQELTGSFNGRLANRIGIEGTATKFAFDALCENLNPVTLKPLTPRKGKARTIGYDINFHCPKSVSILHILAKDGQILEAFRTAVQQTMRDIEADSKTRVRKSGKDEDRATGELIWTDFIHQTARPVKGQLPDPHLHCHCFTFNATYDPVEQQFKAGQFRDIKRDMPYYEARFHKTLADSLVALGYQVRPTKNSFEVVGFSQQAINLFSKRTNEIGQVAKEKGITDAKQLDGLGAKTRAKKQKGLSMDDLKAEWKKQLSALGLQVSESPIRHTQNSAPDQITAAQCIDHSLLHHFERACVVQDRRLLGQAYRFGIGKTDASIKRIDHCFKNNAAIIAIQDGSRVLCTTQEVLQEEQYMISLAHAGKGKIAPLYQEPPVLSLQGEQENAARHVLLTTDQVSIIMGGAGTGKTTLMKDTIAAIEKTGKQVTVVAPTAQASRGVLRNEGFKNAQTVAKLLSSPELQRRLTGEVLWVDEAGLLSTKDMTALLELAVRYNTRVILSGDTRQHASVQRGDALRILTASGFASVGVNKIYRQRNQEFREAVEDLSQGNITSAFDKMDRMGSIKSFDGNYQSLVGDYMAVIGQNKTALIVSPTHAQGEAVTSAIRDTLRQMGKIGQEEKTVTRFINLNLTDAEKSESKFYQSGQMLQFNHNWQSIPRGSMLSVMQITGNNITIKDEHKKSYTVPIDSMKGFDVYQSAKISLSKGDVVSITRNSFDNKKQALNNGQVLEVVSVAKGEITVHDQNSKAEYTLPENFGHLSHAYCITSHASQGKTVEEVFIVQPAATFPASDMRQFYVSVSRARDKVHVYTDNKDDLLNHVSRSGNRTSAMELVGYIATLLPS